MSRVVLSIGSNLGDRLAHLRGVIEALRPRLLAVSSVYSTPPWGGVPQQDYLNAVLVAQDPNLEPSDWLRVGQELEQAAGRVREVRWGARTLDVDIVWAGQRRRDVEMPCRSTDPTLTLPHPRAQDRAFVLVPWLEVEPEAELEVNAGVPQSLRELIEALDVDEVQGVRRTELALGWPV
ncbi:2-amino-4-hydroxy-6-hydroxymethyldihydropteridine diphosphokinase [Nocardia sp. SYP-A9097]|uniref:2-amino-4-hydroxy-6- hydroxymethyldihydropteridine diphosphokinase n=1 Tax=Nocardia sp. SYP-A9097 TaxID=2663237 RepID=UPI00132A8333|nr:2-amino-4-hydroxy-6-hydroxymethyldihydropteridine diphosphokinase [Nocardia sp. SYP-A9097]MRH90428.1 2-amino-4-hydroxy-6-hydroxymethyldihydropteridine diphosphokinase [Nocardia sp. SYP-A9097]